MTRPTQRMLDWQWQEKIGLKDRKTLDDFISSQKGVSTEAQAYEIIDKGFVTYGIDNVLKTLFRDQTQYKYSSVKIMRLLRTALFKIISIFFSKTFIENGFIT